MAIIKGTSANDPLTGGDEADSIYGYGGDDTLIGNGGGDLLDGGADNDNLQGGEGDDTLVGRLGNDILDGGNGNDTLTDNDGDGIDMLYGRAGDDKLFGAGGDDRLEGGTENDRLEGGGGNDHLLGGDGIDLLNGGLGNDIMEGGLGNDTYVVDSIWDTVFEDANGGIDTIRSSIGSTTLSSNVENLTLEVGTGPYSQSSTGTGPYIEGIGNNLDNTIKAASAINNRLYGAGGNDTLIGSTRGDLLIGGEGNDTIRGNGSSTFNDVLSGENGNDTLIGGTGFEKIYGGDGSDSLDGGDANDYLYGGGGSGNDTLKGGNGDDHLWGGGDGNDVLTGGEGADQFYFGVFDGYTFGETQKDTITDFVVGVDEIVLYGDTFSRLGSSLGGRLLASDFAIVTSDSQAEFSSAGIVYNSANGNLFYNTNGAAAGFYGGGKFATLSGSPDNLSHANFYVDIYFVEN